MFTLILQFRALLPLRHELVETAMHCPECKSEHIRKNGKNRQGKQNYICVIPKMLKHSIRLLIHYLRFWDVPVPYHFIA